MKDLSFIEGEKDEAFNNNLNKILTTEITDDTSSQEVKENENRFIYMRQSKPPLETES
jgi:hypothetical protein